MDHRRYNVPLCSRRSPGRAKDRHQGPTFVGKAVPSKSGAGLVLYIPKGIRSPGRVLLSPENSEKSEPELVND